MIFKKLNQTVMGQMFRPHAALYEYQTERHLHFAVVDEMIDITHKLTDAFGPGTRYIKVEEVVEANPNFDYDVNRHIWYWKSGAGHAEPELFLTTEDQLLYLIMSMENVNLKDEIVG